MWRALNNYLRHAASKDPEGWHPLLAVFYLTYACKLRCPYCSDGSGTPYWKLKEKALRGEQILELLAHVRRYSDHLVITGGEPLQHPDFGLVMERLPELNFDGVVLTTIGLDVGPQLAAICRAVRYLVFSLETLDRDKADGWFGRPGTFDKIVETIESARKLPGRKTEIIISAVATPNNLDDLYQVWEWSKERGFRFAVCPQLMGVNPHPDLFGNPAYQELFDFLIAEKKAGQPVNGTLAYLQHMRDLIEFDCRPSTVLAVSPSGDVFYPCLEKGLVAGNLLQTPDLHRLRKDGKRIHGPEPKCPNQCHSACALGFSMLIDHPLTIMQEVGFMARAGIRRLTGR